MDVFTYAFVVLFFENTTCYHIAVVWSCNSAMWVDGWEMFYLI